MSSKILTSNKLIGIEIIENAISIDEALISILKIELKQLKKYKENETNEENLRRTIHLIRNIIIALTLTDDKLKLGIELYNNDVLENKNPNKHINSLIDRNK